MLHKAGSAAPGSPAPPAGAPRQGRPAAGVESSSLSPAGAPRPPEGSWVHGWGLCLVTSVPTQFVLKLLERKEKKKFKESSVCLYLLPWDSVQLYTMSFFCLGGVGFGVFFLFFKPSELCTAVDKDYTMFVLKCCYGSAYGFIWWKFAGNLKEVLCMHGKQT